MTAVRSVPGICLERGIDARRLAELAGLDGQRVAAILLGRWAPSPEERDAIAAVFGRTRDQVSWGHAAPV
jgi:transcriptional regulator with XRE-family HTH domain